MTVSNTTVLLLNNTVGYHTMTWQDFTIGFMSWIFVLSLLTTLLALLGVGVKVLSFRLTAGIIGPGLLVMSLCFATLGMTTTFWPTFIQGMIWLSIYFLANNDRLKRLANNT